MDDRIGIEHVKRLRADHWYSEAIAGRFDLHDTITGLTGELLYQVLKAKLRETG